MDPSGAAPPDAVLPRWPVYVRFGDNPEVLAGDVYADGPADLILAMATMLRSVADHLEDRVSNL